MKTPQMRMREFKSQASCLVCSTAFAGQAECSDSRFRCDERPLGVIESTHPVFCRMFGDVQ